MPTTYLTDRIDPAAVSDAVRHQDTIALADDLSDFDAPSVVVCSASSDAVRDRLCAAYCCEKLKREKKPKYKPGDRAIVGSWDLQGRAHWCLRTFQ